MISPRPISMSARPATAGYLRVLREQWLIVAISVVVCIVGGQIGRQLGPASYTAESDLLISPVDPSDDTFVGISVFRNISADPTANSFTLARYLNSDATANLVKQNLHSSDDPGVLLSSLSLVPVSQTNILAIRATASTPKRAQLLANAFADAAVQRRTQQVHADAKTVIDRLQQQIAQSKGVPAPQLSAVQQRLGSLRSLVGLPDPTLAILNHADTPGVASKPSAKLVYLASAIAGLLLGFAIALLADSFGGKIRREDDLLLRDRLPVLARVPKLSQATVTEYLGGRANLPAVAWESYRTLRANILRTVQDGRSPVVLVTSAGAGDGKTLTALNLAVTLAAQDMRVVLVDGDFRRPMVGSIFGVASPRDGFASAFIRGNVRSAMVDARGYANLRLLLPTLHDLAQIDQLDADRVAQMYDKLREVADIVVVDSAPAAEVSDALLLASAADMTLIAVRLGYTRRDRFDLLRDSLAQYGVTASGLVVTIRNAPADVVHGSTMPVAVDLKLLRPGSKKKAAAKTQTRRVAQSRRSTER
jgi:Mrp family chromosome partitioning ATPase/capsular polysaccharide biosynthesis protein